MAGDERGAAVERLLSDLDHHDGAQFLIEHLAAHGPDGLDVQTAAQRVLDAREEL